MKLVLYIVLAGGLCLPQLMAQSLQQNDLEELIRRIPPVPPTAETLHKAFTKTTPHGEKFMDAELLNPLWVETKLKIAAIHDAVIRRNMKASPRNDMPDSVHYEEERLKLALRPILGAGAMDAGIATQLIPREKIIQLLGLQQIFDWQAYYKEHYHLEKIYREKEADLPGENSLEKTHKKLDLQQKLFGLQQALWVGRLEKYKNGIFMMQQLAKETVISAPAITADVQARALEAIEKLIWNEMQMVMRAELIYQDLKILESY